MISGNKGEWSEVYAFFKILSEGNLYPGDSRLNRIPGYFYPVISVLRKELGINSTFFVQDKQIIINTGEKSSTSIPLNTFAAQASHLLSKIKTASGPSFTIASTQAFLNSLGCHTIKADSSTKADIIIQIHDSRTNLRPILGFSIKSKLGGASTLLNASTATNFTYTISGKPLTAAEATNINAINTSRKIRDRIVALNNMGCNLDFLNVENKTFHNNLVLVDSLLPNILSSTLVGYYSNNTKTLCDVCNYLDRNNPLNYDQSLNHKFYEHKLKRFLSEVALGMMPNTTWTGLYDGTEGYIVIKEDGEVVCYHIINRNLFEDYLLANTKLETPSSTRHQFGSIYQDDSGGYRFKLNLQIRFI